MSGLSRHQRDALDRYVRLVEEHPDLFRGRPRRPIVLDVPTLEEYAAATGVVLGVAAATPYLWLVNDLVVSTQGDRKLMHPYLRLLPPPPVTDGLGVVVLATTSPEATGSQPLVVLVEQERHATGRVELELPRGFAEPGVDPPRQALEELASETGWLGTAAEHLGTLLPDSGTSAGQVGFFHVEVTAQEQARPETEEAISAVRLMTMDDVWAHVDAGRIRDGFTVQALTLYQRRHTTP